MNTKVLCVDDDQNLLAGYKRNLHDQFEIETALSAKEGIETLVKKGPFALVISDMSMPGVDGIRFLSVLKDKFPDTVRIMLSGNADMQTAIKAVNEGNIFQFLTKPCPPEMLKNSIVAGLRQYQLITSEKELLEKTLKGIIRVLSDILAITNPMAFSRTSRIVSLANKIIKELDMKETWKMEIASMLSQIGCIAIPEETLKKAYSGERLDEKELNMMQSYTKIGHELLSKIPRLDEISKIVYYQQKRYDGHGVPNDGIKEEGIPLGARVLKIILDYDTLLSTKISENEALNRMHANKEWYDPKILTILDNIVLTEEKSQETSSLFSVNIEELKDNMVIAEDVVTKNGKVLLPKGQKVTSYVKIRLQNYAKNVGLKEPIKVIFN